MKKSCRANEGAHGGVVQNRPAPESSRAELTSRQIEALSWAARGKTSAEIALILGLTKRTVDFHICQACMKLGAATRVEAVAKAALGPMFEAE